LALVLAGLAPRAAGGSGVEVLSASGERLVLGTSLPGVGFADTIMADGQEYEEVVDTVSVLPDSGSDTG